MSKEYKCEYCSHVGIEKIHSSLLTTSFYTDDDDLVTADISIQDNNILELIMADSDYKVDSDQIKIKYCPMYGHNLKEHENE